MTYLAPRRRGGTLTGFHDAFDDLFNRFFGDFAGETAGGWVPALDVAEGEDAVTVKAELPGVQPDDIDLTVEGNSLILSGEKKETREENEGAYHHVERRYGRFRRTVPLPAGVDAEKIEATHHDGVLTITLPKSEAAKPRRISVKGK